MPQEADWQTNAKAESARIFSAYYAKVNADPDYQHAKQRHQQTFG